ncbi:MAG TPA: hypothetical protein VFB15_08300 [Candidatus Binataceae bacterium]|nr:hypothetical protein [Candidatus Binataceae bacterium]
MKRKSTIPARVTSLVTLAALLASMPVVATAQDTTGGMLRLYVDPRTHIVYTEPGRGRVLLTEVLVGGASSHALQEQQQKTQQQLDRTQEQVSELARRNQRLEATNLELTRQMADVTPAWRDYLNNLQDKFRIGALFWGDYRFYSHTGFQPAESENLTNPGPWNNNYSSFDISRIYLNTYFFPTKDVTFRFTPELYQAAGASNGGTQPANVKYGQNTAFASNLNGDYNLRLKFGLIQYNTLWDRLDVPWLKGGTIAAGALPNVFVPWVEDLYGFRYVNRLSWNYVGSLSSAQLGIQMEGPVKPFDSELVYGEYALGVYNNANFNQYEQDSQKQVMARGTIYPFGSRWRFQGLGLTGFYNYGYGSTVPDSASIPQGMKGGSGHIERISALLHYAAAEWGIAGEFDYGVNALSLANLFSGSAPGDLYGFPTGTQSTTAGTGGNTSCAASTAASTNPTFGCYNPLSGFGAQTGAWSALLNNGQARQVGASLFGHFHIPGTPFTPFGAFEWWQPNDKVNPDPLDFIHFVAGVSYQYNEFLRFAIDSQNTLFYQNQMSLPVSLLEKFNYVPGAKLNGYKLPASGSIPYLVPLDTHAIFANVEFSY